jgi:hypothetical protein
MPTTRIPPADVSTASVSSTSTSSNSVAPSVIVPCTPRIEIAARPTPQPSVAASATDAKPSRTALVASVW